MKFSKYRNDAFYVCSAILLLLAHSQLSADQSGDFTYEVADGKATITDYPDGATGSVVIPSQLGGVPVTHIGDEAFDFCSNLTSVTIPSTVTTIGRWAFYGCNSFTSVTIPSGVTSLGPGAFGSCSSLTMITAAAGNTTYSSLDGILFNKAQTTLIQYPSGKTGSYLIPDTVDNIAEEAFSHCGSLTSVTIQTSVSSIGMNAFFGCGSLTSVTIPSSVTSIGDFAFGFCSSLTEITVAAGNGNYSSLEGVLFNQAQTTLIQYPSGKTGWYSVPHTVTSVSELAFSANHNLTGIHIPNSVTSIGSGAFLNCSNLGSSVTIPSGVTSIESSMFYNCTSLQYVDIPSGVTQIGTSAFYNCSNLRNVTIPSAVSYLGSSAFSHCHGLTDIVIPSSVTSIGDNAFLNCSNLASTYFLGNAPAAFGSGVFDSVETNFIIHYSPTSTGFTTPTWNGYNTAILGFPLSYEIVGQTVKITDYPETQGGEVIIPDIIDGKPVTSIGNYAFQNCSSLTSVVIPSSVTSIGESAFKSCTSMVSVTVPSSVNTIGKAAFYNCSSLESITIPNDITDIYLETFYGCSSLSSVLIPSSVTMIGHSVFSKCSNLTSVTIPSGVASIGDKAFSECSHLTEIIVEAGNANYSSIGGVLFNLNQSTLIQYPGGLIGGYTIPDSVTNIGNRAFAYCSGLTSVTIPSSVGTISDYAFANCSGLTSVTIPSGTSSIGVGAFQLCNGLTGVSISASVNSMGNSVFAGCSSLLLTQFWGNAPATFGANVFGNVNPNHIINYLETSTGFSSPLWNGYAAGAFTFEIIGETVNLLSYPSGVSGAVTIPESIAGKPVTRIEDGAFQGCTGMTSVIIPSGVTSIGDSAFQGCSSLTLAQFMGNAPSVFGSNVFDLVGANFVINYLTTSLNFTSPLWNGYQAQGVFDDRMSYEMVGESVKITGCDTAAVGGVIIPELIEGKPVTHIDNSAFANCRYLTNVTIPDSVTSIGNNAFWNCNSLTAVEIPNSVTQIRQGAFWNCTSLTTITIPNSVSLIIGRVFQGCTRLTDIIVDTGNPNYASHQGVLFNKALTNVISCPEGKSGNYHLPPNVTSIGHSAFVFCIHLTGITLPSSVTLIRSYAFAECSNLERINLPRGLMSVDDGVFSNCNSLTRLIIPNSVTSIGNESIRGCVGLTRITIPSGVTSVGDYAFYDCSNLTATYFTGNAPATMGYGVFNRVNASHRIYYLNSGTGFTSPTWNGYSTEVIDVSLLPFAGWLLESDLAYNTNINHDLNGDGVSLLMAYALDLNPRERLTDSLPQAELGSNTLSMSFYGGSAGVSYRVESSKDLDTWETGDVTVSAPDGNGILTASIDRDDICKFLRLVIVED